MRREQLTEKILDTKREKGWSWKQITDEIGGMSPVLVVGALLGQMKLVKPLAKKLIDHFHGFAGVLAADRLTLAAVPGMGDAAIAALMAVREAGLRLARTELRERPVLGSWQKVIDYCTAHIGFAPVEEFHLLFLDRKNALIADERQQRGTVDHTPVYPREVVKRAIELGASALIMAQDQRDHPSVSRINGLAVA